MNKTKSCPGKDNFERINYLYQISNTTFSKDQINATASTIYLNLLLNVAKKSVQRIEPDVKRSICKKCHTLMIANVSATVRIRKKNIRWTCKRCKTTKVFKAVEDYMPWSQNPEAIIETLKY